MKAFLLAVFCCFCVTLAPVRAQITGSNEYKFGKSVELANKDSQLQDLLPSNLLQSLHLQQPRILNANSAQVVQHPQGAQSYYIPPDLNPSALLPQPQSQQQESEVIQLQVPTTSDEKNILLRLPQQQQQYPGNGQFPYQIPPRRHYKITVLRSAPPKPPPPPETEPKEIEEKTLIYVLVKKPDEATLAQKQEIQQTQQDTIKFNKPEVYFIKYKESEHQQSISVNNNEEILNSKEVGYTSKQL